MLFLRDFTVFTGGHLKVWHYYGHTLAHPRFDAAMRFTKRSLWDDTNPWLGSGARMVSERERFPADAFFLGGMDWLRMPRRQREHPRVPVVNIIQAVHHADPSKPRYQFLPYRAIRICVGPETTEALAATGRCNGPLVTIDNGIELDDLPPPMVDENRPVDLLIAGKKAPELARRLAAKLSKQGRRLRLMDTHVPHRWETIEAINQARVTLFLPNPTEGFYLPALEGMALRSLVVCPDVIGNRSFCLTGTNCFRPEFTEEALRDATEDALALGASERYKLLEGASETARKHDMTRERAAYHEVLNNLDELFW